MSVLHLPMEAVRESKELMRDENRSRRASTAERFESWNLLIRSENIWLENLFMNSQRFICLNFKFYFLIGVHFCLAVLGEQLQLLQSNEFVILPTLQSSVLTISFIIIRKTIGENIMLRYQETWDVLKIAESNCISHIDKLTHHQVNIYN